MFIERQKSLTTKHLHSQLDPSVDTAGTKEKYWKLNDWCFRPRCCTVRINWARDKMANEMNIGMNHAPGAGSIAQPLNHAPVHKVTDAPLGKTRYMLTMCLLAK